MGWSNAPGYRAAQLVPCSHALRRPQLFRGKITPPFHARFGPSRQTLITGNAPSRLFGLSMLDGQTNAGTLVEQRLLFRPFIPPPSQLSHPPQPLHPHRVALLNNSRRACPGRARSGRWRGAWRSKLSGKSWPPGVKRMASGREGVAALRVRGCRRGKMCNSGPVSPSRGSVTVGNPGVAPYPPTEPLAVSR